MSSNLSVDHHFHLLVQGMNQHNSCEKVFNHIVIFQSDFSCSHVGQCKKKFHSESFTFDCLWLENDYRYISGSPVQYRTDCKAAFSVLLSRKTAVTD